MQALQLVRSAAKPATQLSLLAPVATQQAAASDATGFQLGLDHARHGLPLPAGHLHEGSPLFAGWQSLGHRPRAQDPAPGVRAWLQLRLQAWEQGLPFEDQLLTPHYLRQLDQRHCPVSREPLHDEQGHAQQRCIVRLRQDAGFAAGHLAVLGATAARALQGRGLAQIQRLTQQAQRSGQALEGLSPAAWGRLLALVAYVSPELSPELSGVAGPAIQAALPSNRLRLLNPVQALQAWATRQLASAGWSQRLQALHDVLPGVPARQAATQFIVALAPHALLLPLDEPERRWALEDLWMDARVQRRWLALVEQLSPLTVERLLRQLPPPPGWTVERHAAAGAVEGWAA